MAGLERSDCWVEQGFHEFMGPTFQKNDFSVLPASLSIAAPIKSTLLKAESGE